MCFNTWPCVCVPCRQMSVWVLNYFNQSNKIEISTFRISSSTFSRRMQQDCHKRVASMSWLCRRPSRSLHFVVENPICWLAHVYSNAFSIIHPTHKTVGRSQRCLLVWVWYGDDHVTNTLFLAASILAYIRYVSVYLDRIIGTCIWYTIFGIFINFQCANNYTIHPMLFRVVDITNTRAASMQLYMHLHTRWCVRRFH